MPFQLDFKVCVFSTLHCFCSCIVFAVYLFVLAFCSTFFFFFLIWINFHCSICFRFLYVVLNWHHFWSSSTFLLMGTFWWLQPSSDSIQRSQKKIDERDEWRGAGQSRSKIISYVANGKAILCHIIKKKRYILTIMQGCTVYWRDCLTEKSVWQNWLFCCNVTHLQSESWCPHLSAAASDSWLNSLILSTPLFFVSMPVRFTTRWLQ